MIEQHPLHPFLPEGARILMLGSFPPARKRWSMDFFYPNFQNDMWRIFGLIFFGDRNHFVDAEQKCFRREDIIRFLTENGIALYDTACSVRRLKNTASDKDLEVVQETDIDNLLQQLPLCQAIVTTGQKATDVICRRYNIAQPTVGSYVEFTAVNRKMRLYRMPSSSRAYPLKLEKKAEYYATMFDSVCDVIGMDATYLSPDII